LKQGGIPASSTASYDRQAFLEKLATKFIPIDLDFPGVRIVNYDPAIFTVEGFMTREECEQWQQAAVDSGGWVGTPAAAARSSSSGSSMWNSQAQGLAAVMPCCQQLATRR
jgi:hypothetical protein